MPRCGRRDFLRLHMCCRVMRVQVGRAKASLNHGQARLHATATCMLASKCAREQVQAHSDTHKCTHMHTRAGAPGARKVMHRHLANLCAFLNMRLWHLWHPLRAWACFFRCCTHGGASFSAARMSVLLSLLHTWTCFFLCYSYGCASFSAHMGVLL